MVTAQRSQGHMTWVQKRVAGSRVGPGVEGKPKGCCRGQDLAFLPSAVHHQGQEPATDRVRFGQMDGQTRVVCLRRSGSSVKFYQWLWSASFYSLIKSVDVGDRGKRTIRTSIRKLWLPLFASGVNRKKWKMQNQFNKITFWYKQTRTCCSESSQVWHLG